MENDEAFVTEDGSTTIHSVKWNENYHSTHGAIQESTHVFIKNGLENIQKDNEIKVFEVGFGTGLNAILSLKFAQEKKQCLFYQSIESNPINNELAEKLNYSEHIDIQGFGNSFSILHQLSWEEKHQVTPFFTLLKNVGKLQDIILPDNFFDCIFFDAFSPNVQPEMWTGSIFGKMFHSLKPQGLLVTYCAKGQVKRDLRQVGFEIENTEGPKGKREMTLAWKR